MSDGTFRVGEVELTPQLTTAGATYYNLSELCRSPGCKAIAFVDDTAFTIQLAEPIHGFAHVAQRNYLRYRKPERWTMSAKLNAKGLISYNLFRLQGGKLVNASMHPDSLEAIQLQGLSDAYLKLLEKLHQRVTQRHIGEVPALPNRFHGSRGFIGQRKIQDRQKLYMSASRYMYPAFADYAARSQGAEKPGRHRVGFPDAFAPYLREASWEQLVRKLFGTRLPAAIAAGLQPQQAPVARLAGAFLVRSLVPACELLDFEIEPFWKGRPGYFALGEVRRLLRAVPEADRVQLLGELRQAPTKRFHELADVLRGPVNGAEVNSRKYALGELSGLQTWADLVHRAGQIYQRGYMELLDGRQREVDLLKQFVADAFVSLPGSHPVVVEDGKLSACDVYGKSVELIRVMAVQVTFSRQLATPGALPRGSELRQLVAEIKREGRRYPSKARVLSLADGEQALRRLVSALNSMLRRHRLEPSPRSRTRLLVALVMFGSGGLKQHNAMPARLWELINSELVLEQVYYGLILNASVDQISDFMSFPAHTRRALSGYEPNPT